MTRHPSVSAVIKKIMEINPDLSSPDLIYIMKQSIKTKNEVTEGFTKQQYVDEEMAYELARATLN